jgi:hypothetical protein
MILLVILLIFSVVLNLVLVFGIVRKCDEEELAIFRLREKLNIRSLN